MVFDYPNVKTGSDEVNKLARFVYSLVEKLNLTLDGLQTDSNALSNEIIKSRDSVAKEIEKYAGYKANKKDVNTALAAKANTTVMNAALAAKENTSDVNTKLANLKDYSMIRKYVFVNGTTGNDNNDGTSAAPVKTLKKALSFYNKGYSDVYIFFAAAGTYLAEVADASDTVKTIFDFSEPVLHMVGSVSGVTVVWGKTDNDAAFYTSHINWENITVDILNPSTEHLYFDCCFASLKNVTFGDFQVNFNAGSVTADSCSFNRVKCAMSNGYFNNCTFRNNVNSKTIDIVNNSSVSLKGAINVNGQFTTAPITSSIRALINVSESTLRLFDPVVVTGTPNNSTCRSAYLYYSHIVGTTARIKSLANLRTGTHSSDTPKMYAYLSTWFTNSGVTVQSDGDGISL